jgi:hypothetical protein
MITLGMCAEELNESDKVILDQLQTQFGALANRCNSLKAEQDAARARGDLEAKANAHKLLGHALNEFIAWLLNAKERAAAGDVVFIELSRFAMLYKPSSPNIRLN